jgi:DNA-directed RNA polymerase subunit RPC12/RpoP
MKTEVAKSYVCSKCSRKVGLSRYRVTYIDDSVEELDAEDILSAKAAALHLWDEYIVKVEYLRSSTKKRGRDKESRP